MSAAPRFHLVGDVIDRVPGLGSKSAYLRQMLHDKLIDHRQYIRCYGQDRIESLGWRWGAKEAKGGTSSKGDAHA